LSLLAHTGQSSQNPQNEMEPNMVGMLFGSYFF